MKRLMITIAAMFAAVVVSSAQGFFSRGGSPNQNFIEEALTDAFRVVRVEFQLEDTVSHERFNLAGKSYFGFSEGLCIKTERGWLAPAGVVTPWKNNLDVRKFPDYKPVLSTVSAISVTDTLWKPVTKYSLDKVEDVQGTSYSCVQDIASFGPGLGCVGLDKKVEGWIVWVSRVGDKLSVTTYSHNVNPADSATVGIGHKVVPEGVVGGFYVNPIYPSVGVIRFELVGVMDKDRDGWKVNPFSMEQQSGQPSIVPATTSSLSPDKPKLVPADGNKADEQETSPARNKKNKKNKK